MVTYEPRTIDTNMTEEGYKKEIERLTALVVGAEDAHKETLDELASCQITVKRLKEHCDDSDNLITGLMREVDVYHNMLFLQRLWWAFTKRI